MERYIRINQADNVAVALSALSSGESVKIGEMTVGLAESIKQGHKFSLFPIKAGQDIIKYGNPIGRAISDIEPGVWVHTHNVKTNLNDLLEYQYQPKDCTLKQTEDTVFSGFRRKNHKVGVRNEIWIIPTVGCVNGIVKKLESMSKYLIGGSLEDIVAFNHPYGCSQMGDDQENTRIILNDMIEHPNAGGVLVLGLGCENSDISELKKRMPDIDCERIRFVNSQDVEDEIEACMEELISLSEYVKGFEREPISVSELIIGLKCGGSDGLSGITCNPAVGKFSDILISKNGTTILTEVPEMFGAETILMNRAKSKDIFDKTVTMINEFKEYYKANHQVIYENPSPGNKEGGITTLEDKSLGCIQKSGSATVVDVLDYGDTVKQKGLNLLSAPGNDLVASTALAAAGCHIVLFTTGRGTPFACPVPTLKISSNSQMAETKNKWIDFNAGEVVEGKDLDQVGRELFEMVVKVASGEKVKSEKDGYHDMAIFKKGVTL